MQNGHFESRRAPRVQVFIKVDVAVNSSFKKKFDVSKKNIEGYLLDVSTLGIALLSRYFFPKGIILDLDFKLLVKEEDQQKEYGIKLEGMVRSAIPWGKGFIRLGIEFRDIDDNNKDIISRFVEQELNKRS